MTKVTNRQIFFILLLTLTSYSVIDISRAMAASAGTGGWLTIMVTALLFGIIAVIIVYLNNMFKGKMMFDYSKEIVGAPMAYAFSLYYILYFLLIAVFLVYSMANTLKLDFFPKTPIWAMTALSIPLFCYIAYKGIATMARMCEFIGLLFLITGSTVHLFMITQGKPDRIRPLFNPAEVGRYFEAMRDAIFPFLGIEVLLIVPMSKQNSKKSVKTAFFAVAFIGLFYVLVVESCIMKLGINDIVKYNDTLIEAIRDMSLPFLDFMERMDVLFLTVGFMGMYLGLSVVFTAITEYLCKIFANVKRIIVVIALGAVVYMLTIFAGMTQNFSKVVLSMGIYLGLAASGLIPIILLITAKVKKHGA